VVAAAGGHRGGHLAARSSCQRWGMRGSITLMVLSDNSQSAAIQAAAIDPQEIFVRIAEEYGSDPRQLSLRPPHAWLCPHTRELRVHCSVQSRVREKIDPDVSAIR